VSIVSGQTWSSTTSYILLQQKVGNHSVPLDEKLASISSRSKNTFQISELFKSVCMPFGRRQSL